MGPNGSFSPVLAVLAFGRLRALPQRCRAAHGRVFLGTAKPRVFHSQKQVLHPSGTTYQGTRRVRTPSARRPPCSWMVVPRQFLLLKAFLGVLAHSQRKSTFLPVASINSNPSIPKPRARGRFWRRAGPQKAGDSYSFARGGAGARAVRFVPRDSLHTPPTAKSGARRARSTK